MFRGFGCRVKSEEQSSSTGSRKKVTFDSNVKTYEHVLPEEVADSLPESVEDGNKEKEMEENSVKSTQSQSSSEASSITSSSGSYPPNHRYQNCRESDDELDYEDSDIDDDDGEDEDDDGVLDYDDAYEDENDEFFESRIAGRKLDSKEIDSSVVISGLDEEEARPIMVNRAARNRSGYVHSVLNPVENLTQWKAVKARGKPPLKPRKENFTVDQEPQRASFSLEASFNELSLSFKSKPEYQSKKANQEAAVDASLSNWLSSSETTPTNKSSSTTVSLTTTPEKIMSQGSANSLRSQDDRPILGALTLEEIKQFSASSPRKSPSRSPDEMPIIGTVGTYWSPTSSAKDSGATSSYKGIPNTTSKYREVQHHMK